jgi:hypothetical protein
MVQLEVSRCKKNKQLQPPLQWQGTRELFSLEGKTLTCGTGANDDYITLGVVVKVLEVPAGHCAGDLRLPDGLEAAKEAVKTLSTRMKP